VAPVNNTIDALKKTQNRHKLVLVAFYDIRQKNRAGLFLHPVARMGLWVERISLISLHRTKSYISVNKPFKAFSKEQIFTAIQVMIF